MSFSFEGNFLRFKMQLKGLQFYISTAPFSVLLITACQAVGLLSVLKSFRFFTEKLCFQNTIENPDVIIIFRAIMYIINCVHDSLD